MRLAKAQAIRQTALLTYAARAGKKTSISKLAINKSTIDKKSRSVQASIPILESTPFPGSYDRRRPASNNAALEADGQWHRCQYTHHWETAPTRSRRLAYWLFVPVDVVVGVKPLPLVVMLHGCEQTAAEFASGTRMNVLAAQHGFATMYPQQMTSANPHRCWPWYEQAVQRGGEESALIAGAIEEAVSKHGFDRSRIYIAGLSAGAALAQIVALRHPHLIAALGSHSGPVYGVADSRLGAFSVMQHGTRDAIRPIDHLLTEQPSFPGMPMLILHGEQDTVVRPQNAIQLTWQFCQANNFSPSAHEPIASSAPSEHCDGFRTTDYRQNNKTLVRLCQVRHLAHAWSGGDTRYRFNASPGPDASVMFWEFFKEHDRVSTL